MRSADYELRDLIERCERAAEAWEETSDEPNKATLFAMCVLDQAIAYLVRLREKNLG